MASDQLINYSRLDAAPQQALNTSNELHSDSQLSAHSPQLPKHDGAIFTSMEDNNQWTDVQDAVIDVMIDGLSDSHDNSSQSLPTHESTSSE